MGVRFYGRRVHINMVITGLCAGLINISIFVWLWKFALPEFWAAAPQPSVGYLILFYVLLRAWKVPINFVQIEPRLPEGWDDD